MYSISAAECLFLRIHLGEELLLYTVLNIEIINLEVLCKQVKNCLKYICKYLLNIICDFCLVVKGKFSEVVMVVDKTRKRRYIFGT